MEQTKEQLLNQLLDTAKLLSPDKLLEALDFVSYLRYHSSSASRPARGSAQALLRHVGAFKLMANELNQILADIAQMRTLDLEANA